MSNGNWYDRNSAWVAFGVYLMLGFALVSYLMFLKGYERSDQDHQSDYAEHYKSQINEQNCIAKLTTEEAVQCYKESSNAARENTRAEQDLNAQREMAYWAELMVLASSILGFVGIGVTAIGIHYVRKTLGVSSAAVKQAIIANNQSRNLFILENRPWLKIKRFKFYDIPDYREDGTEYTRQYFGITVENIGNNHARNVQVHAEIIERRFFVPSIKEVKKFALECNRHDGMMNTVVFAKDKCWVSPINPSIELGDINFLICITYGSYISDQITYRTACCFSIRGADIRIHLGSTYAT